MINISPMMIDYQSRLRSKKFPIGINPCFLFIVYENITQ